MKFVFVSLVLFIPFQQLHSWHCEYCLSENEGETYKVHPFLEALAVQSTTIDATRMISFPPSSSLSSWEQYPPMRSLVKLRGDLFRFIMMHETYTMVENQDDIQKNKVADLQNYRQKSILATPSRDRRRVGCRIPLEQWTSSWLNDCSTSLEVSYEKN